ncbi:MAG: preprotein translocase subunit SecA [Candidatus Chisholmbacteria bacterium]|nr:preprotein translocase subunit SecA [Candidatus Chisholmbacteria bacterium]
MFKFLSKLLDSNEKQLRDLEPMVAEINEEEKKFKRLSDESLKNKTAEFKLRLGRGESWDDILPEAFAAVREASRRNVGLRHFDVQLMAGIVFHQGRIAEQKTGEGKTLSATTALYLNSLTQKGVHLVTVNDYLARRDAGWMGPIFQALGVSVGVIIHDQSLVYDPEFRDKSALDERLAHLRPVTRREAYEADVTYGTNNEFGFDYLRDNMVQNAASIVQRGHHFAIVDEVDSILVDEARTPLIISAPDTEPTDKYYRFATMIEELAQTDYVVDEKLKTANLTDYGIKKVEKKLGVDNLYERDFETLHHLEQALRARTLFRRDRDYVVKDGEVIIVDEHTGRLMFGRRYSEGLHQAIEAKENVKIQQESRTLATISLQNYFRLYEKLAGMTGTAATEAEEFGKIYKLDVVVIPTHKPMVRTDHPDSVYKTVRAKYGAIVKQVAELHQRGQPVLMGTRSIEHNEIISEYLKRKGVPHQLLNAKNHEKEALIIANAGKLKAVTVATNIAGRGVDIVLGGAVPDGAGKRELATWQKAHDQVVGLGGLMIIGTERHESRRIDNQLRGRSGRQGDPGESRFYVALEDEIMRLFGGETIANLMTALKMPEDQPIEHGLVSKAIEQAQSKIEGFYFDQRKRVVEYDDVMNKQREIVYRRRREILEDSGEKTKLKQEIGEILDQQVESLVLARVSEGLSGEEVEAIGQEFTLILPLDDVGQKRLKERVGKLKQAEKIIGFLQEIVDKAYQERERQLTDKVMREVERFAYLSSIDSLWMDHLDAIDDLREGIGLRGYGQRDPLIEYKAEAFSMFEQLMVQVENEVARRIFRVQVQRAPVSLPLEQAVEVKPQETLAEEVAPTETAGVGDFAAALARSKLKPRPVPPPARKGVKIGRNDPCPCGAINPNTGKPYKYKKCGMVNAPYHKG